MSLNAHLDRLVLCESGGHVIEMRLQDTETDRVYGIKLDTTRLRPSLTGDAYGPNTPGTGLVVWTERPLTTEEADKDGSAVTR